MAADKVHEGKTWRDIPGANDDQRKFNFALWRRGVVSLEKLMKHSKRMKTHSARQARVGGKYVTEVSRFEAASGGSDE